MTDDFWQILKLGFLITKAPNKGALELDIICI